MPADTTYAGFWIRVLASVIDTLLVAMLTFPILLAIYGPEYFDSEELFAGPADVLVSWVLPGIAIILFWIYRQATPGKMWLRCRIIDAASGQAPGRRQCIGRYLGYFVSTIPLGLGLLWVAFDPRKQGWHDKLAGTVVVRVPKAGAGP
jgi:uncharacterized RDD family membrane protein YckC